ncbi:hypothetical protein MTO96_049107 [Rhipicephalus appendiculatus]
MVLSEEEEDRVGRGARAPVRGCADASRSCRCVRLVLLPQHQKPRRRTHRETPPRAPSSPSPPIPRASQRRKFAELAVAAQDGVAFAGNRGEEEAQTTRRRHQSLFSVAAGYQLALRTPV